MALKVGFRADAAADKLQGRKDTKGKFSDKTENLAADSGAGAKTHLLCRDYELAYQVNPGPSLPRRA